MEILGVTKSVVHYLRINIITGALAPGQKLNEEELSNKLNISRPPLREAFRILENEHLIINFPRKGCYVSEISMQDCRDIFEAREMIECFSVDLLKAKGIRELPEVSSVLSKTLNLPMPTNSDPDEKFDYLKAIADFHLKLVELAGNSRLIHFYQVNFSSLARYQSIYTFVPGLMNKSQEVHEQILDDIKQGQYDHARGLLKDHINSFYVFMETKFKSQKI